ncbi:HlyD family efflux transporter periplasmic adaptor subunit [Nostoc sp. UCD121]|uniref:HlyD family efflux transporter periplasmic adaptor subunit n=1 Tax=unclassified Nostoc TaxID=2593658 RepID=UPI0016274730|nr:MULTISPECIES: HlyD family efflux transporter periplasmic adaptor subunit [unclassified Nostoc]MBC1218622.1 HlyD family efflux transporter periplasmic adaptor subunit [Nostoc sp. UCD120]MBC1279170.1 HlyD family efflux transporter periplasmic adaptor subunit [Nostoc sp. UCD121]MBC1294933.1 HlyD family efflux transporter periplasmic adaptor subunit [Nostoc sp. UCD122]
MVNVHNTDFLQPIQTDEFLPPISRWITFGGLFVLCVLGLAIPVATVTKYKVTVKGQAVVRPSGEVRIVQAATEGQVMQIHVKENQVVKAGDAIAIIDDSRLQTKKSQLQTNIEQAKLQLVQIKAQIHTFNRQTRAETAKFNRIMTASEATLSDRQRQYQDKKISAVAEFQEAQANLHSTRAALNAAKLKQKRYESVAEALSRDKLEEAQLATKQQEQAVFAAIAKKQRVEAALNPSHAEVEIATERIAQEKYAGESHKAVLEKERQGMIKQQIEVEKQLERDTRELQQVENELNHTTITATADGIISQINLRNPGQTVRPGEEVLQIVPSHAKQIVKAVVASEDKSKLKIGQQVQMRVSACPYPDYGTLNGKVEAISPDAMTPPTNSTNGSPSYPNTTPKAAISGAFYQVTIEPESLFLGKGKNLCPIQLGMEGRVDIISREETVLQFFLRKARLIADV